MEELLKTILSDPETVNKIITELGPKALDNAEHIVISGIETTGQVLECLVKDGKIVEHTAKTVQETVKSTENVAISIVETGGRVCEYLIKDGEIVRHTAETVQLGIKTTGDVAKELIDKGAETTQVGVKTTGDVAKELIDRGTDTINTAIETVSEVSSQMFDYKAIKQAEKTKRNQQDNQTAQEKARIAGKMYEDHEKGKTERNLQNSLTKQKAIEMMGLKILVDGKEKTIEWDSLVEICQAAINSGNPEIGAQMLAIKYQTNAEQAKFQSDETRGKWNLLSSMLTRIAALGSSVITPNPAPFYLSEAGNIGGKIAKKIHFLKNKEDKKEEIEEKEKALEFMQMAYDLNSKLNTEFPASQFPMLNPIKRLLDASVKQKNPSLIALTVQVIQEEISNMQDAKKLLKG